MDAPQGRVYHSSGRYTTLLLANKVWIRRVAPRLLDGLPEYLSVQRDPAPGNLTDAPVHFLRPGDPLFEGLCDEVVERFRTDTQRGGIFRDPTTEKPYGVAFYVCQIGELAYPSDVDERSRTLNLLDRRLLTVRWDEDGNFDTCAPNHLLTLQPAPKAHLWKANRLLRRPEEQVQRCDQHARALAESHFLQQVRTGRQRNRDAPRRLAKGFDFRAAELAEQRGVYGRKARDGDSAAQARLAEVKTQQIQLQEERVSTLLREQRRSDLLEIVSFERIAVGLVIPDDSPEVQAAYDQNIEAIAIRIARNFEVDQYNARVIDVSAPHLARGYDLESHRANGEIVAIEVKGRADRGQIQLTENEWPTAINVRDRYWLYVVVDCATNPVLYLGPGPSVQARSEDTPELHCELWRHCPRGGAGLIRYFIYLSLRARRTKKAKPCRTALVSSKS